MRAAILHGAHDFKIEKRPLPVIQPDEYLIRVRACGVCHSEIHQWNKTVKGLEYPRFIGHEVSGVILEAGNNVKKFKHGDRVAVWLDGNGYGEVVRAGEDVIFPIADNITFEEALAEPIGCATNGVIKSGILLGETVVLVGVGFMGLIMLQQIKLSGALKVIAIDTRNEALSLAESFGADVTINPLHENADRIIRQMTGNRGADVCIEIGGVQQTLDLAAQVCRMEGRLVIFGYHPGERVIKDLGYWNWMAFDIRNAHFRERKTILRGSEIGMFMLNAGQINMKPLVTHKFSLDEIEQAFTVARDKPDGFVKSVVVLES